MKKAAIILFSFFYLLISAGLAINLHYCQGELESVQLFAEHETCCCGDSSDSDGCCQDHSQLLKYENEQIATAAFEFELAIPAFNLPTPLIQNIEISNLLTREINPTDKSHAPPPVKPAWLMHCSLILYG